jgi:hypothetical protein
MSQRHHRRNSIGGPFAPRLIELLKSPAYRALTLSAHRLLARIEIELHQHGGEDNGKLPVTYDQFVEYGIHRHAIAPAIRLCEVLGLIEVTQRGRAGNWHEPNYYRLTYCPVGRARPTHEWRRVRTMEEAKAIGRTTQNPSAGKRRVSDGGNHHHKPESLVVESTTTALVSESTTTSRFSDPQRASLSPRERVASRPRQSAARELTGVPQPQKGDTSPAGPGGKRARAPPRPIRIASDPSQTASGSTSKESCDHVQPSRAPKGNSNL